MSQTKKGKKRRKRINNSSSDESEEEYTITKRSQSSQTKFQPLSTVEMKTKAGQVCNMMLAAEVKKVPVKLKDIKSMIKNKHFFTPVMKEVENIMKHLFGYKIVVLNGNQFILVNEMATSFAPLMEWTESEAEEYGVLIVVLIGIFMSEGKMSAEDLNTYLDELSVGRATVTSMLQTFVRKNYLKRLIDENGDVQTLMYMWGERADSEFSKKEILETVCKVYGTANPSMWAYQWKIIKDEESTGSSSSKG